MKIEGKIKALFSAACIYLRFPPTRVRVEIEREGTRFGEGADVLVYVDSPTTDGHYPCGTVVSVPFEGVKALESYLHPKRTTVSCYSLPLGREDHYAEVRVVLRGCTLPGDKGKA